MKLTRVQFELNCGALLDMTAEEARDMKELLDSLFRSSPQSLFYAESLRKPPGWKPKLSSCHDTGQMEAENGADQLSKEPNAR